MEVSLPERVSAVKLDKLLRRQTVYRRVRHLPTAVQGTRRIHLVVLLRSIDTITGRVKDNNMNVHRPSVGMTQHRVPGPGVISWDRGEAL